ncbi:MAG: helix-turn-helix domain-containing protein [Gammaproteobacteria bacterium]|nr:helix-turn-helix domain-containing protein [Gammaproteobacteria bacterium]
MMREIETTSLCSAAQRVCDYLLNLPALVEQADELGEDLIDGANQTLAERVVTLPVSKGVVASLLSITPEHFSRVLRELQTEGLIDMQQRTIRLLAPDRLARRR